MPILDSSLLVAFKNERDVHHQAALAAMKRIVAGDWGPSLLPEYVFLETLTVLAARRGLEAAVNTGAALLNAREVQIVPCSEYFAEAFEIFRTQRVSAWSFVDAALVAIARRTGVRHIATFDADFHGAEGVGVVP